MLAEGSWTMLASDIDTTVGIQSVNKKLLDVGESCISICTSRSKLIR